MRLLLSIIGASVLFVLVFVLGLLELVALPDYWTQLAVALTLVAIGILCWGLRPEIDRWFARRNLPKLEVVPTEVPEGERIKEIEIVLRDGSVLKHEARFCYVTVKNAGRRSANDVEALYDFDGPFMLVPLRKKATFRVYCDRDMDGFQGLMHDFGGESGAFEIALLWDERWRERFRMTVNPGPEGETFVLFFTLKDFRVMAIPSDTRRYLNYNEGFPCKVTLSICLRGKGMPDQYVTTFEIAAQNWKDFTLTQMGKTVKRPIS